ncbi:MAG: glycosyltransferase [Clostridiaceae bacterium]|nr:glycosyltransferase [Clostridiaceae bacterium]
MKQVNILLSAYNGETYLEEQVKSIIRQTYTNWKLYIRDDGSSDNTVAVLERLRAKYPDKIVYWRGENIGFGKSFLELLEKAEEGDYWAFCDQDDVWLPDKLFWAIEWLEQHESREIPILFHSAFTNTDEALNPQGDYLPPDYRYDFIRSITDCLHMGFSEVINAKLREMMLQGDRSVLTTHDHWAELLVMEFGHAEFDPRAATLHRRLDNSVSEGNWKNKVKWFRGAWHGDSEILPSARELMRVFGKEMKPRDRAVLKWFVYDRYSLVKSIKKAFYPHRWRPGLVSECCIRFLMLFGRI